MAVCFVLSYLGIYQPDEEQTENGEDEQHDACVEICHLHAAPTSRALVRAVAEVAYHGAAFHYSAVRILYRVYLQAVGSGQGAEEVAEVGVTSSVVSVLASMISGVATALDVADGIHVAQCHGRLAEVVDEIACRLHVAGVAGDYPAVVPDVAAFAGDGVVQFHTHGIGLLDGPDGVAAPGEVNPRLVLGHHFFLPKSASQPAMLGFISLRRCSARAMACGGVVVHQLLYGDGAVGQLPGVGVDDGGTVGIAVAVLHQYFAAVLESQRMSHVSASSAVINFC